MCSEFGMLITDVERERVKIKHQRLNSKTAKSSIFLKDSLSDDLAMETRATAVSAKQHSKESATTGVYGPGPGREDN